MSSASPLPAPGWRTFLVLWGSQSVSRVGSAVAYFALIVYLAQTLYPTDAQKLQLALATGAVFIIATTLAVLLAPHDREYLDGLAESRAGD